MPTAIIYHSETGTTRTIARALARRTGAELIEVEDRMHYGPITRHLVGGRRALFGQKDRITPAAIDVSAFDLLVIGTPVWMRRPTPAVIFATCCLSSIHARNILERMLAEKGVRVQASVGFSRSELTKPGKMEYLAKKVEQFSTASPA
jgi:hypothetical protein